MPLPYFPYNKQFSHAPGTDARQRLPAAWPDFCFSRTFYHKKICQKSPPRLILPGRAFPQSAVFARPFIYCLLFLFFFFGFPFDFAPFMFAAEAFSPPSAFTSEAVPSPEAPSAVSAAASAAAISFA